MVNGEWVSGKREKAVSVMLTAVCLRLESQYSVIKDLGAIGRSMREQIEAKQSEKVAMEIIRHLAKSKSEIEKMIQTGHRIAKNMSWDVAVKNYLLPSLQKALNKQRTESIYTKT